MIHLARSRFVLLGVLAFLCAGIASADEDTISIQGGVGNPWQGGSGGAAVVAQYAHRFGSRNYLGFEVEYRDHERRIWKIDNIDVETFDFRLIYRIDLAVDSVVTPYFTFGFGGFVTRVEDPGRVEAQFALREPGSIFDVKRTGGGFNWNGVFGLDVSPPGTEAISFFGEARFDYGIAFHRVKEVDPTPGLFEDALSSGSRINTHGGISGQAGIRFHF